MSGMIGRWGSGGGRGDSYARRMTLLSWLLAITLVLAAESAWVLWLQYVWAETSIEANPRTGLLILPSE